MQGEPPVILLTEDNDDHAEVVRRSFRDHQVANEIRCVPDGAEALDYLFGRGIYSDFTKNARPHLILLDLRLPKVDGLAVLKTIKESKDLQRIPVVVLTTSQAEKDVAMAYDHHANIYVVKPLDFRKFTEFMKDLLFYGLGWNFQPGGDQAV